MLFSGVKKEAFSIHAQAVEKYNQTYDVVSQMCEELYLTRKQSVTIIEEAQALVNTIANSPKEFEYTLGQIKAEKTKFSMTEEFARKSYEDTAKAGASILTGVGAGVATASFAPTAAMWVATTFGTASTGTAISSLSGAVATKAALAWLGGGALEAGGAGVMGGQALLALAGPIGWGITAATTAGTIAAHGFKNKKVADAAVEEAKEITIAGAQLKKAGAFATNFEKETTALMGKLKEQLAQTASLSGRDYPSISNEEQALLGTLVNNTLSLAEMLNRTAE